MEKLTKEQRNQVYRMALNSLDVYQKKGNNFYMCNAIERAIDENFYENSNAMDLPEFASKKPEGEGLYVWFDQIEPTLEYDYESRRRVLTQCIEETNP